MLWAAIFYICSDMNTCDMYKSYHRNEDDCLMYVSASQEYYEGLSRAPAIGICLQQDERSIL